MEGLVIPIKPVLAGGADASYRDFTRHNSNPFPRLRTWQIVVECDAPPVLDQHADHDGLVGAASLTSKSVLSRVPLSYRQVPE